RRARHVRVWCGALLVILLVGAFVFLRPRAQAAEPGDPDQGLALGMALGLHETTSTSAEEDSTTTTTEEPTTTEAPTTTGTTLPLPDPPPSDPYAPTPVVPLATITIPKLNVRTTMYQGITLPIIDLGTGHWPGTPAPGDLGNMVVAGHRTLHSHPFADL